MAAGPRSNWGLARNHQSILCWPKVTVTLQSLKHSSWGTNNYTVGSEMKIKINTNPICILQGRRKDTDRWPKKKKDHYQGLLLHTTNKNICLFGILFSGEGITLRFYEPVKAFSAQGTIPRQAVAYNCLESSAITRRDLEHLY